MAPVVRITDDVFERLQRYAQPFVDTPSSVIARLLDRLEGVSNLDQPGDADSGKTSEETTMSYGSSVTGLEAAYTGGAGLFLAPASEENAVLTLDKSVPMALAQKYLTPAELASLSAALGGQAGFRCWAMTKSRSSTFSQMRVGDLVLFAEKGTGSFTRWGLIAHKFVNRSLGAALWPNVPSDPWDLIYVLRDVSRCRLDKTRFVIAIGYDKDYKVPGIVRVKSDQLTSAIRESGGWAALIRKCSN